MSSISRIRALSEDKAEPCPSALSPSECEDHRQLVEAARRAILLTQKWLIASQQPEGYWVGELEGDTILESEYLLLLAFLGRLPSAAAAKASRYILDRQLPDGGWAIYPGGALDISASVKAYFALKLTGHEPSEEPLQRARLAILRHGGADAVNSFTRFYLALLGQISYAQCPAVPPEFLLLPSWFPVNLHSISAWSRTILVPLSIISAFQPVTQVPAERGIRELFLRAPQHWPLPRCPGLKAASGPFSWERYFRLLDRLFKFIQRFPNSPLRLRSIRVARDWILQRFEESDGLGAIFPPMVWSIIALRCLGYSDQSPELEYCHRHLEGLILEDGHSLRLQPCKSPVWDTALVLRALADSGVPRNHIQIHQGVEWLLQHEVRRKGDWAAQVRGEPSGWYFQHANAFYPDCDDTAMVLLALLDQFNDSAAGPASPPGEIRLLTSDRASALSGARQEMAFMDRIAVAIDRGSRWLLAMQNRDGGWAAFDRDNTAAFLCHVPFADHNAMIDPSSPDLAARVLECLGRLGRREGDAVVDRCVAYLKGAQEPDGSWFGRWGVNYIYGTWQVLVGLRAAGLPADDPCIQAGGNWLLAHQLACGGWGESPDSYADPSVKGHGPVTASQTAWALLGLMAAGRRDHPALERGIRFLLDTQEPEGTWREIEFTGTGFPRVFYLRYHLYPVYFPLMALSRWARLAREGTFAEPPPGARLVGGERPPGSSISRLFHHGDPPRSANAHEAARRAN